MKHPILALTVLALAACSAESTQSAADLQVSTPSVSNGASTPAPVAGDPVPDLPANAEPAMADKSPTTSTPAAQASADKTSMTPDPATPESPAPTTEVATLAAGCYWCIEAVVEQLDGVEKVESGFMGGNTPNPTYGDVVTGTTGYAEVIQVTFDPTVLPYKDLLDWFWKAHDPTTLNRQGADRGTQYRSAIFVHSPEQRKIAEISKKDVQPTFDSPIVTEITDASTFYKAKEDHQGYYFDNANQGYCRAVIAPKLKKLGLKY